MAEISLNMTLNNHLLNSYSHWCGNDTWPEVPTSYIHEMNMSSKYEYSAPRNRFPILE